MVLLLPSVCSSSSLSLLSYVLVKYCKAVRLLKDFCFYVLEGEARIPFQTKRE